MDNFFNFSISPKVGSIGTLTHAIVGLVLFAILSLNFSLSNSIIPEQFVPYPFAYFGYLIIILLVKSIVEFTQSKIKGKKCHYCKGPIQANQYKCMNPLCGKIQ